jgi:branched-subunit amino acid transport protein
MDNILLIVFLAALVYGLRVSGFVAPATRLSPFWARFLGFVPVSVFAALTATPLLSEGMSGARATALAASGLLMWRTRQLGVSIALGLALLGLLQALGIP